MIRVNPLLTAGDDIRLVDKIWKEAGEVTDAELLTDDCVQLRGAGHLPSRVAE